jgi:hypothetical protein
MGDEIFRFAQNGRRRGPKNDEKRLKIADRTLIFLKIGHVKITAD